MSKIVEGDIVFFCHSYGNGRYRVKFGIVDAVYCDGVVLDYLAPCETRMIDGVPLEEFKPTDKFKKLPKGWTYNTELFSVTYRKMFSDLRVDITDPASIKHAYEIGALVKRRDKFNGNIEAEITKEGWRIVLKYPMWNNEPNGITLNHREAFLTYKEAKEVVDKNLAEFKRQLSLTDAEWSKELIDKEINHWILGTAPGVEEIERVRGFFDSIENIEDVEARVYQGRVQWKYEKNKRWYDV